jgi:ABC-2 type transport system permease protein
MSTATQPAPSTSVPTSSPSDRKLSPRRTWSLAAAEIRLLLRNKALLFYSAGLPVLGGLFMLRLLPDTGEGASEQATRLVVTITGFALLFGVYYSLVSTFVARRQDLVLKRLRSGESSVVDVLTAISMPSLLVMLVQTVVASVLAVVLVGAFTPVNVALVVVAVLGGGVVVALLAAISSAFSSTVESVQVTTLPLILVLMAAPGFAVPASVMPDAFLDIARFLPMSPVVELIELGISGVGRSGEVLDLAGTFSAAALPLAVLVAWGVVGVTATIRYFRWEPRR